jgi:hypothetical protein
MKKYFCLIACIWLINKPVSAQMENPSHNVIQLALLLDVSGSMEGLIDQAKSELWTIVNEVAKAKKRGHNSRLEIALYEYGRTSNPAENGYIVKLLDYTSDLDTISKVLFSLNTNGGDEYCGWVIKNALHELQWRDNDSIYRVIFIAGNEPFNQGSVDYKNSTEQSGKKGIVINTIHCGDSMTGVNGFWRDGAAKGNGSYFFINQNSKQYDIPTPYDSMMGVYNDSMNSTYWSYGTAGGSYKANQFAQDNNAEKMSKSVKAKRAVSKTQKVYDNKKWDAVDAAKSDSTWITKTKDEELPAELKGKNTEEKKIILDSAARKRAFFSDQINRLNILREEYIRKNKPVSTERSLGMALVDAIHRQATVKGFVFE